MTAALPEHVALLAEHMLLRRHGLEGLLSAEMLEEALGDPKLRGAFAGGAFLAMGAAGSGGCFHRHEDALLVQLVGQKRWFVNKHGTLHKPLTDDEVRTGRARDLLRKLSPEEYWTCTQSPGDLMWVPEGTVQAGHPLFRFLFMGTHTQMSLSLSLSLSLTHTHTPHTPQQECGSLERSPNLPWNVRTACLPPPLPRASRALGR